jgi:NAD(P)-dependent dehydrogenase (short-subunit alcohol dehydrogenase family)
MRQRGWTLTDLPLQSGRTAVVTGASAGLGLETAKALSARGATVVLACRDVAKAEQAAAQIAATGTDREALHIVTLDLGSLASVRAAAREISSTWPHLDLLINNAGVMSIPFQLSEDGVELTFATNHLGHFALTGLLLDRLLATAGSRIVTVSSNAHRRGEPRFDDPRSAETHDPGAAYDASKLANLLFTYELQRRLAFTGGATIAVAAHPGNARTDLWRTSSQLERALIGSRLRLLSWLVQGAEQGSWPTLRAAADAAVSGGDYYGPRRPFGYTGAPERVQASPRAHNRAAQRCLWELSEQLTGVAYPLATPPDEE